MEKKTAAIIGLIGGIIAAVGVFLSWGSASVTVPGFGTLGGSWTGWDIATAAVNSQSYPYIALAGGVIALIGALGVLGIKSKAIGYLLPLGGIIAIIGAGWGFADISGTTGVSVGYGIIVCIVGGILALIGSLSLKGE